MKKFYNWKQKLVLNNWNVEYKYAITKIQEIFENNLLFLILGQHCILLEDYSQDKSISNIALRHLRFVLKRSQNIKE